MQIARWRHLLESVMSLYYRLRYPYLTLEKDVRIAGRLTLSGSVRVHIGRGTRLRKHVRFFGEGEVTVGEDCLLNGCVVGSYERVEIAERCLLADCYLIDTDFHNVDPDRRHLPLMPGSNRPIRIGPNAWIGSGAKVLKGVTIGENSVVGLGSVVRRNVPANVIVIGNPEQIVRHFDPAQRAGAIDALARGCPP